MCVCTYQYQYLGGWLIGDISEGRILSALGLKFMFLHSGTKCACAEVLSWGAISETPVKSSPTYVSSKAR